MSEDQTSGTPSNFWIEVPELRIFAFQPNQISPGIVGALVDASFHATPAAAPDIEQERWEQAGAEAFWRLEAE